jgi:hypothetical protein
VKEKQEHDMTTARTNANTNKTQIDMKSQKNLLHRLHLHLHLHLLHLKLLLLHHIRKARAALVAARNDHRRRVGLEAALVDAASDAEERNDERDDPDVILDDALAGQVFRKLQKCDGQA